MDVLVKLCYKETHFQFVAELYEDFNHAEYMWTEGNYSCDCNRSLFIKQNCDETFPEKECGHTIELINLEEVEPST